MCGIFGAVTFGKNFNQSDYEKFVSITNLVSYRGPDATDCKKYNTRSNFSGNDCFNIFLGHRRLSIIDLSIDGLQPFSNNNNHIIYNGEIFNYIELKEELRSQNIVFQTNTDTEVILKIYETFGSQGFSKLNGMWAFVIIDLNKQILIASRDRFSIKPLYLHKNSDRIYFASEIKQILEVVSQKNLNLSAMSRLLYQGILDLDPETFFKGIEALEPKHNLVLNLKNGEIKKQKYWDYNLYTIPKNDIMDKFRQLFYDSIRIRLRSDVEVGALLSGGLDSSAISVVGKNLLGDKFKTYSVISKNKKYSEEFFIDELIRKNNIRNEKLFIDGSDILKNFQTVIKQQDEPFLNFIVVAHYSILQKIKSETDITVVLSGQGGDEVLAGYLRFFFFNLKFLYRSGEYLNALKEVLGSFIFRTIIMQWRISAAKRYLPGIRKNKKEFILLSEEPENTWKFNNLTEAQIMNIDKYSIPTINRYEDRNSMAHSLEIRLPFLDHRLVEFVLSLNADYKIKNGWNKYILRKSMFELPAKIRWRRDKRGFILPEDTWLKNDFRNDIVNTFNKSLLEEFGIINGKKFLENYYSYLNGDRMIHSLEISRVYIAEKWMRNIFK